MFFNEAQVCLTGYVATQPVTKTVKSGAITVTMRVAWTPRWQDRVSGEWVDGNTSYVTVNCWRKLATNAGLCVRKGDPVVVKGRLSIRNYEDKQGAQRIAVEVEASTVGHDLSRGIALFQRVRPQTGLTASEFAAANGGQPPGEGGGYEAGSDGDGQRAPEFSANGAPTDASDRAGAGLNEYLLPEEPGAADPFFEDSGSEDVAQEKEQVAAPF